MTSALHSWVIHNLTDYHRIFYGPLQSPQTTADKWKPDMMAFCSGCDGIPLTSPPSALCSLMFKLDELHRRINSQIPWTALLHQVGSLCTGCVEATGKAKGGGMRFFINNKWCTDVKTVSQMLTLTKFWTRCAQPICKPWHPDAFSVIMGNFNHCNLKTMLAKYYQHVTYPMRRKK